MAPRRSPGLRTITTTATVVLAIVAVGVSAALVLLTTNLHRAATVLRDSVASVRLAEGAEIDLLVHDRARDHLIRADVETDLRQKLIQARSHVSSSAERAALEQATGQVERYLDANRDPQVQAADRARLLESSYSALKDLVYVNVSQADVAAEKTARWDQLGNVLGIVAGVLMLAALAGLFFWLRRSVIRPIAGLANAMERFGIGALDARAERRGAAELREMTERFNAMADTLVRQRHDRLVYLAGIAHDLRNPLAALQMSTAAVDPERPLPAEERVRHTLGVVQRQVARLNRMVGDLLETARIEAGQLSLRLEDRDLRVVVRNVMELFEGTSPIHRLAVEVPEVPVIVRCDPFRIEQTLNNLLSNAIKYSPRGGTVRVALHGEEEHAVLSVSDEGIGIAEEELEHLWEPFRRTGASTEAIPGVGLGLSIAKRIVEAHGGEIDVVSAPGMGTRFTVMLPMARHGDVEAAHEDSDVEPIATTPPWSH